VSTHPTELITGYMGKHIWRPLGKPTRDLFTFTGSEDENTARLVLVCIQIQFIRIHKDIFNLIFGDAKVEVVIL